MVKNKRLLIISNEPLSDRTANGRTLKNLLSEISPCDIAQFYIHGEPDASLCSSFFSVTDSDALNAFLFKRSARSGKSGGAEQKGRSKKIAKNCRNMVFRDMVWKSMRWCGRDFWSFVESFAPNAILFQAGDSPFMYTVTMKVAKKYSLPIIMYNSEEYPLKDKIYNEAVKNSPFHLMLRARLRRAYKKIMKRDIYCIYGNRYLEERYLEKYQKDSPSAVIYTSSYMKALPDLSDKDRFSLLYCGNLGVGRDVALGDIAAALMKVNRDARLYVYGKMPSESVAAHFGLYENLVYCGEVSYEKIPEMMSKASMLVHCENNSRVSDLKAAFSTKIADSLASGRPFLVYASREFPFVEYLKENDCALVAEDEDELQAVLRRAASDFNFRNSKVVSAVKTAEMNHNYKVNGVRFKKILDSVCCEDLNEK